MPDATDQPILSIDIRSFGYEDGFQIKDIRLSFRRGELVALVGPNGSGKSTLLKLNAGLLRAEAVTVELEGRSIPGRSPREGARFVSWVPQRAESLFSMTVREMVRVGLYRWHRPFRTRFGEDAAITRALDAVGLEGMVERDVETLSGGEWQRALIARAIAQDTPVMLLDEPVASLDLRYQEEVYRLLRRLASDGRLILVADHHLELAAAHADRIVILHEGRLAADGPPVATLTSERVRQVFGVGVRIFPDPVTGTPRLSRPQVDGV